MEGRLKEQDVNKYLFKITSLLFRYSKIPMLNIDLNVKSFTPYRRDINIMVSFKNNSGTNNYSFKIEWYQLKEEAENEFNKLNTLLKELSKEEK